MSDVVKWGILAALVVALIALVLGTPFMDQYVEGISFLNSFNSYATEFVAILGECFGYARRLINNFLPAQLVTITIALTFARKPLYLLIEVTTLIIKAIYK